MLDFLAVVVKILLRDDYNHSDEHLYIYVDFILIVVTFPCVFPGYHLPLLVFVMGAFGGAGNAQVFAKTWYRHHYYIAGILHSATFNKQHISYVSNLEA